MQAQASSFDRISPTALIVAYARQFTDIPYAKELSKLVDAQTVVEQLQKQHLDIPVEVAVLVESRYKATNRVMAEFKASQILELASGLLPRGLAMSQNPTFSFVESDLPAMISQKQQLVKQLVGERANLHFAAIDATSQPSQFPVYADYLNSQKPITVLCEGLLTYLTLTQKQHVFANIRELLQVYGGLCITPDLITKEGLQQRWKHSPRLQNLAQTVSQITGISQIDNTFDSFDQAQQFISEQGFQLQKYSMLNVLDELTCLQSLDINPTTAEFLLADSLVFALTLRDT